MMERERVTGVEGGVGEWERVPRSRLAPGGPGSTDLTGWLTRGSVVLLALALVWLGFSAVRPLARVPGVEAPEVRAARGVDPPSSTVARRESLLSSLTGTNWFDPERHLWSRRDLERVASSGEGEEEEEPAEEESSEPIAALAGSSGELIGSLLRLTAKEDLPDTLGKAYENLELLGIRMTREGVLVGMVSFVQSSTRGVTREYRVGDTFTDERYPQEEWRVVAIDGRRDRMILRRAGTNVALPLFRGRVAVGDEAEGAVSEATEGVSREEIIAQLRAAGISEAEIAELMRLAEADDGDEPGVAPDVKSLDETMSELDEEEAGGIGGVLEMMKETERTRRPRDLSAARELAFPEVDTYGATGGGHGVSGVDAASGVVTLEDGSRWGLSGRALSKVARWAESAPISVFRGRGTGKPYVIVNEHTKEFVEADHLVGAPEGGEGGDVESAEAGESGG